MTIAIRMSEAEADALKRAAKDDDRQPSSLGRKFIVKELMAAGYLNAEKE